ncbi:Inner-membrane translocator (fragment) [Candidatus Sulfopaludibacter sp. SbA4]
MTNRQLSALCGAFLAGSLLVAGTNVVLVRSALRAPPSAGRVPVVAVMPRIKGDPYFASCRGGAEEAARELGIELIWEGPIGPDSTEQIQIVETWITRRVDAIAVAAADQAGISPVLRKARAHGIPVVAWDSDAEPDARDLFVNPANSRETGQILAGRAACLLHGHGEFAILTGASNSAGQWIAGKYPELKLASIQSSGDDRDRAFLETQAILRVRPGVKLIVALSPPAVPGAAEAVLQSGRQDVKVIGLSWNTRDLGYLTVQAATLLARHRLAADADSLPAGRLGNRDVCGGEIVLGPPLVPLSGNLRSSH